MDKKICLNRKIYLANGLFNESDLAYNEKIYNELTALGYNVYAPQKNASINDKSASATSVPIYEGDTEKLKEADILIAVLDGVVIDPGVASEVGWVAGWNELAGTDNFGEGQIAYFNKWSEEGNNEDDFHFYTPKLILGLYTDTRDFSKTHNENKDNDSVSNGIGESQYSYANLYTIGCCKKYGKVFNSLSSLVEYLKKYLEEMKELEKHLEEVNKK